MDNVISNETLIKALEIYENKMLSSVDEREFETSEKFEKKMRTLLRAQTSVYRRVTLTKTRKVITAFAAALMILVSALSVGAIRETILSFFVERGDVRVIEYNTENGKDYPKALNKLYALSYLPKGYKLTDSGSDSLHSYMVYTRGDDFLSLEQFTKDSYKSASDLETMEKEVYEGVSFVVQQSDDSTVLIWEKDGYVFEMTGFEEKVELFKAAVSLKSGKEEER